MNPPPPPHPPPPGKCHRHHSLISYWTGQDRIGYWAHSLCPALISFSFYFDWTDGRRVPLPHLVIIIIAIHSVPFVALPIHSVCIDRRSSSSSTPATWSLIPMTRPQTDISRSGRRGWRDRQKPASPAPPINYNFADINPAYYDTHRVTDRTVPTQTDGGDQQDNWISYRGDVTRGWGNGGIRGFVWRDTIKKDSLAMVMIILSRTIGMED